MAHRDEFVQTLTEKLTTYALGRIVQSYDMPAIRTIMRNAHHADYSWSSLILGIVNSRPFQMRMGPESMVTTVPTGPELGVSVTVAARLILFVRVTLDLAPVAVMV